MNSYTSLRAIASDSTIFYNLGFELISHVLITEDNPRKENLMSHKKFQKINMYISNLVCMLRFWNNLDHVCSTSKDWKGK